MSFSNLLVAFLAPALLQSIYTLGFLHHGSFLSVATGASQLSAAFRKLLELLLVTDLMCLILRWSL